jgi:hypothetical protein
MGASRRALAEDRRPAETGLGSLQDEEFEEHTIVMDRHALLVVVTGDVQRIGFDPLASRCGRDSSTAGEVLSPCDPISSAGGSSERLRVAIPQEPGHEVAERGREIVEVVSPPHRLEVDRADLLSVEEVVSLVEVPVDAAGNVGSLPEFAHGVCRRRERVLEGGDVMTIGEVDRQGIRYVSACVCNRAKNAPTLSSLRGVSSSPLAQSPETHVNRAQYRGSGTAAT